ncbi:hypothetical protein F558DRAFT_03869 [Streptomyces sp. AmelKG-A3]|nr:hypothetical protein GA0115247_13464 [Streptomyces sp. PalvLS-984]SDD35048.1 hypothetical protein F558DRAFT_03869 [Streptomyces sp. AmelKG-A3]
MFGVFGAGGPRGGGTAAAARGAAAATGCGRGGEERAAPSPGPHGRSAPLTGTAPTASAPRRVTPDTRRPSVAPRGGPAARREEFRAAGV